MQELGKDLLLILLGMGIDVVLMCIISIGKEVDRRMEETKENKESEDN